MRAPSSVQTPRTLIHWAADRFEEAGLHFGHGTDNALDEAAWLVGYAMGVPPEDLEQALDVVLDEGVRDAALALIARRVDERAPAAYLTGEAWFAGLPFYVDRRVIVPRSHLAEPVLERFEPWIESGRVRRILELCTGSGCIAVALAHAFPDARIDATDLSADALDVARRNVARHGVAERVRLVRGDLFEAVPGNVYDLIVSNPPYVPETALDGFPAEYLNEPRVALAAGRAGLDIVARILAEAAGHLSPGGLLAVEVGDTAAALETAYPRVPFTWLATSYGEVGVFVLSKEEMEANGEALARGKDRGKN
jgi:ribosomal protein L3 glutamine methyltransferase